MIEQNAGLEIGGAAKVLMDQTKEPNRQRLLIIWAIPELILADAALGQSKKSPASIGWVFSRSVSRSLSSVVQNA